MRENLIEYLEKMLSGAAEETEEIGYAIDHILIPFFENEDNDITDKIVAMNALRGVIDTVEGQSKALKKAYDRVCKEYLPEAMEDAGIDKISIRGVGTAYLQADMYVSMDPERRDDAYQWLEDTGNGDLIKMTVNSASLAALIKGFYRENVPVPSEFFNVTPYTKVVIKKY